MFDTALDGCLADELIGPDVRAQLVLRHGTVAMLDQELKCVEHLGSQRNRQTRAVEQISLRVEPAIGERVTKRSLPTGIDGALYG